MTGTDGVYKSAVLLASLGTEVAAQVLSRLDETHVEALIREMTRLGHVRVEERDRVLEELQHRLEHEAAEPAGGLDFARNVLEQAVGPEKAGRILSDISPESDSHSLAAILEYTSPASLAVLVADEHPQWIALLAGQLSVEQAAAFLAALPAELRGPVTARLAELEAPAPMALQHLQRCLLEKLRGEQSAPAEEPGTGPRRVAEILGRMRRSVESMVLSSLEEHSPTLAEKVNQYRFTFENLLQLESRSLQRVLRDIETDTLRLAMKGLDEEQQQIIYSNMSERAAARLKEDLENSSAIRLRDVETAQQAMVAAARALEESGEIQLPSAGAAAEEDSEAYV
jgi:flagellar motor switch protein FliG